MYRQRPAWCSVNTPVMWSSTTTTSKLSGRRIITTTAARWQFLREGRTPSIATMGWMQAVAMAEEPQSVGGVFSASLPTVLATGMVAIGCLLISMQIQSARIEATVVQMAKSIEELKNDARTELADLDRRVRALEIRP